MADVERKYHAMTMDIEESPEVFILKKEKKRKELNKTLDAAHQITDENFIKHVLVSLPAGKEKEVGLYSAQRRAIEKDITVAKAVHADYEVKTMTKELMKVYKELYPDSDIEDSDDDDDWDTTVKGKSTSKKSSVDQASGSANLLSQQGR